MKHDIAARPPSSELFRKGLRFVRDRAADALHPNLPPRHIRSWISPLWFDYERTGRDQLEFFVALCGLEPTDRFLDIACGVGRIARPLTTYLTPSTRYEGFDIEERCIRWCRDNIGAAFPNFRFSVADVKTSWSPNATWAAEEYEFPYDKAAFDFVYAGSIFTHVLPAAAANYLRQVARVLRAGQPFVATWLIYNKEWKRLLPKAADLSRHWPHDHGTYRTKTLEEPERSVAFEEQFVRRLYSEAGLTIVEPIRLDASYCPARIPDDCRSVGMHLYYSTSIIAVSA
jgi:SAM-dependent methyltransferase